MGTSLTLPRRPLNPADTPPQRGTTNPAGPFTNRRGWRGCLDGKSRRRGLGCPAAQTPHPYAGPAAVVLHGHPNGGNL